MRILIIEDEPPASQRLQRLLKEVEPGFELAATVESVEDAVNVLNASSRPDLIFMDIQLDDGLCFEIFEKVEVKSPVIFITAYDEYAIKAFKVNSVDYLLKPLNIEDLKKAIQKFKLYHQPNDYKIRIENIINGLQYFTKERFLIKIGEHFKSVQATDVVCFYIRERSIFIFTTKGKSYPVDYSLDKIEQLIDARRFFRVNRNYIINFLSIKDIIAYSSSRLKIVLEVWDNSEEILVSRERVAAFKEWMDR